MEGGLFAGRSIRHSIRYRLNRYRTQIETSLNARRPGVHQTSHATKYDRHPEILGEISSLLPQEDLRILSFGCSSGEETETLAQYFPAARIVGADISTSVLRSAARRCRALLNVTFINTSSAELTDLAPFDVVFAMSVLCRHPETKYVEDSFEIYPFETFERGCDELAALLRPGGLLVIYNANCRFADTCTAKGFSSVALPAVTESGSVVKFDRDGHRLSDQSYDECVFSKVEIETS